MDIEEPIEIENEMNFTRAIEILNKLKSKVTLVEADKKEYRLPFVMNIEKQAIETVLSELEKKDRIIKKMAKDITISSATWKRALTTQEKIKHYENKVEREGK